MVYADSEAIPLLTASCILQTCQFLLGTQRCTEMWNYLQYFVNIVWLILVLLNILCYVTSIYFCICIINRTFYEIMHKRVNGILRYNGC